MYGTNSFKTTPAICYDLRFPELFRTGLSMGANLFVVLGCWPKSRIQHWVTLLKARAIENQAYMIGVNRVGNDQELEYGGRSMIISPQEKFWLMHQMKQLSAHSMIQETKVREWRNSFLPFRNFWTKKTKQKIFILRTRDFEDRLPKSYPICFNSSAENSVYCR